MNLLGADRRRRMPQLIACLVLIAAALLGAAAARAETRIAVIGDSNVAGFGVAPSDAYPAQLERALRAKGLDVRVRNAGLNGDTTAHLLSRLDAAVPDGTRIAVVWIGTNDLRQGVPPATVQHNIDRIAARLRARGIAVVRIARPLVARVAARREFVLKNGHLNPAGYDRIVAQTLPAIEELVARGGARRRLRGAAGKLAVVVFATRHPPLRTVRHIANTPPVVVPAKQAV